MTDRAYDLEERLLDYAVLVIHVTENMRPTRAALHVGDQFLRCGTSPLFNHGEAQAAESQRDFIHKLKLCLKELREAKRAIRLIGRVPLSDDKEKVAAAFAETEELIRIFVASIRTAQKNAVREEPSAQYGIPTSMFDVERSVFDVSQDS